MSQSFVRTAPRVSALPWALVALRVVGFAALVAGAAQVRVFLPFTPVPMTLQLLAVLLAGLLLRPAEALAAMVLYVAAGEVGLPAYTAGSLGLKGITGGYIAGFVVGAWCCGWVRARGGSVPMLCLAAGSAVAAVLVMGVGWIAAFHTHDVGRAWSLGFAPFWYKALIEMGLAIAIITAGRQTRRWLVRSEIQG